MVYNECNLRAGVYKVQTFGTTHTQEEPPSCETAAVLVPLETLEAILKGLQSLNHEVKELKARLNSLEVLEEIYHGPAPQPEEVPLLRECWTKRREVLDDLPSRVWGIEEDLSTLEKAFHKTHV